MRFLSRKKLLWAGIPALLLTAVAFGVSMMNRSEAITVPAGTEIQITLNQSIGSDRNISGDLFTATVAQPVLVEGKTVIPKDAPVKGQVTYVHESGRVAGVARVCLTLLSVTVDDKEYEIRTSNFSRRGGNHKKRNWAMIGGGAGGGALIGALAGGAKGAAIGGPIGAGAGIAAATITGKKDFVIRAETLLSFELTAPVEVDVKS